MRAVCRHAQAKARRRFTAMFEKVTHMNKGAAGRLRLIKAALNLLPPASFISLCRAKTIDQIFLPVQLHCVFVDGVVELTIDTLRLYVITTI